MINKFRNNLKKQKPQIGFWSQTLNFHQVEMICQMNYSWICFDMEHGIYSFKDISILSSLVKSYNKIPFVRVQKSKNEYVQLSLDAGILGIILPMIENGDHLLSLIKKSLYPPFGNRSVGFAKSNNFGFNLEKDLNSNFKPFIVAQIESKKGVEKLDEILVNKGLDSILIGPYDLSASYDIPGDFKNTKFKSILTKINTSSKKHKIYNGYHVVEPSLSALKQKILQGYRLIAYGTDTSFIKNYLNIDKIS